MVTAGSLRRLGVPEAEASLRFGEGPKDQQAWAGRRFLYLKEKPAFELSFWCGTCPFLFERLEGANSTLSLDEVQHRLAGRLDTIDDGVVEAFSPLLPDSEYLPMLLRVEPVLVTPAEENDYFSHEQVATWGIDAFWGLPEHPRTRYYRTFETAVDSDAHLYEFVVPMVPPNWNDRGRVDTYIMRMDRGDVPTAVALSILDVCQPAVDDESTDYYTHWALTHFLLDGHHKLEAAASSGNPVQILSLLLIDACLAEPTDLGRLVSQRAQPMSTRVATRKQSSRVPRADGPSQTLF